MVSLFSGCGGFDLGFKQEGFKCAGAFDINENVLKTYEKNLKAPIFVCDLSTVTEFPFAPKEIDVLLAGSPCQGFSTLGKRCLDDPRNNLLLSAGEITRKLLPKVFISENVPGVISGAHKKYWEALHTLLRCTGYQTTDISCKGTDLGIAQTRTRMFLFAWRNKKSINLSLPKKYGRALKDVLNNLDGVPDHHPKKLNNNTDHYLISKKIKQDQKLSNVRAGSRSVHTWEIPEVFGFTNQKEKMVLEAMLLIRRQRRVREFGDADPIPAILLYRQFGKTLIKNLERKNYIRRLNDCYDLMHTFNGKYRRLSWDKPSYTVDTRFGVPRYYLHPDEHRGFTIREAARIQGFHDSFTFEGSEVEKYRMIGNAVSPIMARELAKVVKRLF